MTTIGTAGIDVDLGQLTDQAVDLLRQFVRFDGSQPRGHVADAADWLEGVLSDFGISSARLAATPDKPNLVATVGEGPAAPLVLSHHMDVVPAEAAQWSFDPFSGDLVDGYVCGRGTLDMKGFGVLSVLCAMTLLSSGRAWRRPLRILATADEEIGGADGAKWLVANHLAETSGEYLLTEGSFARAGTQARLYPVVVAEKGVSTLKLTTRGKPGHASAPTTDNALVRLVRGLARLADFEPPGGSTAWVHRLLAAVPRELLGLGPEVKVEELSEVEIEELLRSLSGGKRTGHALRNTFTPTMISSGIGQNVIPASAEAFVDCRTLPGLESGDLLDMIGGALDDPEISLELVKSSAGTDSDPDTELFVAFAAAVERADPGALVLPYLTGGGTDAKHYRPNGVTCYGLIPFLLGDDELRGVHGIDERVSVENLRHGLRIMLEVTAAMCLEEQ